MPPRTIKLQVRHFTADELSLLAHRAERLALQCDEVVQRSRCRGAQLRAVLLHTIAHACTALALVTPGPQTPEQED